jgi:hypothetical protein
MEEVETLVPSQKKKLESLEKALQLAQQEVGTQKGRALVSFWVDLYSPINLEKTLARLRRDLQRTTARVDSVVLPTPPPGSLFGYGTVSIFWRKWNHEWVDSTKKSLTTQLRDFTERCDNLVKIFEGGKSLKSCMSKR